MYSTNKGYKVRNTRGKHYNLTHYSSTGIQYSHITIMLTIFCHAFNNMYYTNIWTQVTYRYVQTSQMNNKKNIKD